MHCTERFLVFIFLSLIFHCVCVADWIEHEPISVNPDSAASATNPHYNSGGRRMVRILDTVIVLCPVWARDLTYRSNDHGNTWTQIDDDGFYSGCLISGPNNMIYHFYCSGDDIYMVKFPYDQPPPDPVSIYHDPNLSESTVVGPYRALNAIVDAEGRLYVSTNWGTESDQLYVLTSVDGGTTWQGPFQVTITGDTWYYPHLEVTSAGRLVVTFGTQGAGEQKIVFGYSDDKGLTWSLRELSDEVTQNPSILTVGDDRLFVFAQSAEAAYQGLVYNQSTDGGDSWSGWTLIDPTCGYADPSPALGADGTIYVAYRSSNGTGVTIGSCGDRSRSRLVFSRDMGETWQFADNYYEAERTGTRNHIRYQTWWNYGGPLEWIWMQYEDDQTQPIYYDINNDVVIKSHPKSDTVLFVRGDCNEDSFVDISDVVMILLHLFQDYSLSCEKSANINGDMSVDLSDIMFLLYYCFNEGSRPPEPFFYCGIDMTDNQIPCESYLPCSP